MALRREVGSGHHQVRPGRHRGVGQAPGVGVEHRHDRQDRVGFPHADGVDGEGAERVEVARPVRVHHALGVARGAARVAHGGGLVLVPYVEARRRRLAEQALVVVHRDPVGVAGDLALAVVHDHQVLDGVEGRQERPQQRCQRPVDEDHLVLGVVDDVGQLLGEEPDVERVQHPVAAGGGEVELEVTGRVPGEGGHPAALADAEHVEHAAEPPGAVGPLPVGDAVATGGRGRHDALVGEQLLGAMEEVDQRERLVLHQALHGSSSTSR